MPGCVAVGYHFLSGACDLKSSVGPAVYDLTVWGAIVAPDGFPSSMSTSTHLAAPTSGILTSPGQMLSISSALAVVSSPSSSSSPSPGSSSLAQQIWTVTTTVARIAITTLVPVTVTQSIGPEIYGDGPCGQTVTITVTPKYSYSHHSQPPASAWVCHSCELTPIIIWITSSHPTPSLCTVKPQRTVTITLGDTPVLLSIINID